MISLTTITYATPEQSVALWVFAIVLAVISVVLLVLDNDNWPEP